MMTELKKVKFSTKGKQWETKQEHWLCMFHSFYKQAQHWTRPRYEENIPVDLKWSKHSLKGYHANNGRQYKQSVKLNHFAFNKY